MAVKEYIVKKDGEIIKIYRSLPAAKQLAEKKMANVYCDGVCIYKIVPEDNVIAVSGIPYEDPVERISAEKSETEPKSEKYTLTALMNVRTAPSLDAEIKMTLPTGSVVDVEAIRDDWMYLTDGTYILYKGGRFAVKGTEL